MKIAQGKSGENGGIEVFDADKIWELIIAILLASAGGFARLLNHKDKMRLQWSRIFSELFISGFAGLMVLLAARSLNLSGDWIGLVCGMAGWIGPKILDLLAKPAGKAIGIDVDKKDENDKQ